MVKLNKVSWIIQIIILDSKNKLTSTFSDFAEPAFNMVDVSGEIARDGGRSGLLIYNNGTVCDDNFDQNAADAICSLLGYQANGSLYESGLRYPELQAEYSITLDDVSCRNNTWSSCTYATQHNCGHSEDVFLTCISEGQSCTWLLYKLHLFLSKIFEFIVLYWIILHRVLIKKKLLPSNKQSYFKAPSLKSKSHFSTEFQKIVHVQLIW